MPNGDKKIKFQIDTTDNEFFRDLNAEKIQGLEIGIRGSAMDSIDCSYIPIISQFVINISPSMVNIFATWLKNRCQKDNTHTTNIHQQNITNNITIEQITFIINDKKTDEK